MTDSAFQAQCARASRIVVSVRAVSCSACGRSTANQTATITIRYRPLQPVTLPNLASAQSPVLIVSVRIVSIPQSPSAKSRAPHATLESRDSQEARQPMKRQRITIRYRPLQPVTVPNSHSRGVVSRTTNRNLLPLRLRAFARENPIPVSVPSVFSVVKIPSLFSTPSESEAIRYDTLRFGQLPLALNHNKALRYTVLHEADLYSCHQAEWRLLDRLDRGSSRRELSGTHKRGTFRKLARDTSRSCRTKPPGSAGRRDRRF